MITQATRPDLIAFMSDVSARTQFILPNRDHIESLPFDGISVNIPQSFSLMSPGEVLKPRALDVWLDPLVDFNQGKTNYLQVYVDRPGDLFDDAAWAQVVENWRQMGEAAERAGFAGILFDNEEYFGHWQDFQPGRSDHTLQEAQAMASQRGREIMSVLAEAMPNGSIAFAHGPYLSVPGGPNAPTAIEGQAGNWRLHELLGPFFTGFLEAMGPGQTLIDAGELYALRSDADFQQSFDYRNTDLPGLIPWAVDPAALANWEQSVQQGHMVYTDEFPAGFVQSPHILQRTLLHAFDHSEGAVFLFSEIAQLGWLAPETLPPGWLKAVQRAVELADNTWISDGAADLLVGSTARNRLIGNGGADTVRGGGADDLLSGGAGADRLSGGRGDDTLSGGAGADAFVLRATGGHDRAQDFDPTRDHIDLWGNAGPLRFDQLGQGLLLTYGDASLLLRDVTVDPADLSIL